MTNTLKRLLILFSICAAMVGCDAVQRQELQVGASKDAVKAQMGQPDTVWKEADGRELWDYPRGPEGTETLRMTISPDGVLKDILNTLTESNFSQIQNGMNKEQVRRLLGRPGFQKQYGNNRAGNTWEWKYMRDRNTPMLFAIEFDGNGIVTGKGSTDPSLTKPQ
jgi:outer membrane protein assembly factor BamE (lipoprotein component of BamABCDE complex)